ncbi:MAG: TlyA family RNA methyltransferase [Myxococcota bacterium]|nr:TlyA family RNA methyltransferase [Myxococcota bacterium]MDW8362559.1 TlyA family RNA methyltransferase [Myxococcales bacterium]
MLLVQRGLAPSRERARALLLAGHVFSVDRRIDKAGTLLPTDAPLRLRVPDHPYVSRGGVKLAAALDAFGVDPMERLCADIGASTGGFTDCLLRRGARRVYAIDVGHGQLHPKLRVDPRVVCLEGINARHLHAHALPERVELAVVDASFISLRLLLEPIASILRPGAPLIALVKPQFEVGRRSIRGGVVRNASDRRAAIDAVADAARRIGYAVLGGVDSVLPGPAGNVEAFLHLVWGGLERCANGAPED